ncbi:MAG TPA: HNH endonuclease signature motif containing protein [Anaeromyxobacter sp.]
MLRSWKLRAFTVRLQELLRRERFALADFLVALAGFDEHRLWVELGYTSLFDFLHRELGLSRGAAFYRKSAAELVQRFPELVEPLRDGRLCLMTVAEVARVLTPENRADVLPRFFGLSRREAQALAAELHPIPVPPVRTVVTAVRTAGRPAAAPLLALAPSAGLDPAQAVLPVEPRSPGAHESERARRAAGSASAASGDRDEAAHGRAEPVPRDPGHVPARVRRAVWKRDCGRCQVRLASGEICGSTLRVQIDHVVPRALGGPSTEENRRLACRVHNDRSARRVFGDACMERFTANPRAVPGAPE